MFVRKLLKTAAIYFAAGLFLMLGAIAAILPARLLLRMGRRCGELYCRFNRKDVAVSEAQLRYVFGERCPPPSYAAGSGPWSPEKLTSKVFGHLGQAIVELLFLPRLPKSSMFQITSHGETLVKEVIARGSGAICLSGHLGCIELLAAYHRLQGVPLTVIGRKPNYPVLADILDRVRTMYGVQTLWRNDPKMLRLLLRAASEKRFMGALIDQDTNLENGFVPFFGMDAAYPITLIRLGVERRMPMFSSFIVRTGLTCHEIITEPIDYDPQDPQAVIKVLTTYNQRLETLIRRYPEQWIWWHRRWRRRPGVDYEQKHAPSTLEYLAWLEGVSEETSCASIQCGG